MGVADKVLEFQGTDAASEKLGSILADCYYSRMASVNVSMPYRPFQYIVAKRDSPLCTLRTRRTYSPLSAP